MRVPRTKLLTLILLAALTTGILPTTANAQEDSNQSPLLFVKIPDIDKLFRAIQELTSQSQDLNAAPQMNNIPMMLNGTDWIDTERSIAVGVVMEDSKTSAIALLPFLTPNDTFRDMYGAQEGTDYYLMPLPPQPEFTVHPDLEQKLIKASQSPTSGSLIVEAAAAKILATVEPQIEGALGEIAGTQPEGTSQTDLSPQDLITILHEMFALLEQAEILRFGIDLTEDSFTVIADIDAQPGTELAAAFVDIGGNCRLMNYPIDMPLRYHTRAYNIAGSQQLTKSYLETVYGMLGLDINIDDVMMMAGSLTGEFAGGMNFTPEGIEIQMAAVLQPGVDGEAFIRDSYLPLLENYSDKVSDMVKEQEDRPQIMTVQRTEDSYVDGVRIMGVKTHIQSLSEPKQNGLDNINLEMRMASLNDMLFIASSDAKIRDLIEGTRNLVPVPASGPTGRLVIDMSAFLKNLKSLIPHEPPTPNLPEDLGEITTYFDLKEGRLATRTSFQIDLLNKLMSAIMANFAQGNMPMEGENIEGAGGL